MDAKELQDLIEQLSKERSQKPGGHSFAVGSGWSPYEEYQRWNELDSAMHGALGAQASQLPIGGREWGVSQSMLAALGAPKSLVQMAQTPQGGQYTPASLFLQRLRDTFGQQVRAQHPGIENIDLNSLMGGRAFEKYYEPGKQPLTPEEEDILNQAFQQRVGARYGL